MSIKIELNIPETLAEKVVRGIMDNFPEASATLRCVGWKYEEMEFEFEDSEDGKTYKLNKEKLMAAFPLIFTDKWPIGCTKPPFSDTWDTWDEWLGQSDANDFDAFVQLACLGDVIYG